MYLTAMGAKVILVLVVVSTLFQFSCQKTCFLYFAIGRFPEQCVQKLNLIHALWFKHNPFAIFF